MDLLSGVKATPNDCCINSCLNYYGPYSDLDKCPYCNEPRYDTQNKPRKQFHYIPLIPHLIALYLNKDISNSLRIRAGFIHPPGKYRGIFDGAYYQLLRNLRVEVNHETLPYRYFESETDICFGLSCDGFCPFKQRKQICWPLILFNYNLPPEERFKLENIICVGCIPSPAQMKDIDSF